MELLQLKYFCDAAERENFSRTAEKYNVPVSNISQTVKRLESELGVKLFRRTANKIALSEEGKLFYDGAHRALAALDEACRNLSDMKCEVTGEIKLLIRTHRRTATLAIEKFKSKYPSVQLNINHSDSADHSDYSFIISDGAENNDRYSKELLLTEKIMVATHRSNPIAKRKQLPLSSLRDENFIMMSPTSSLGVLSYALCRSEGFVPKVVISTDDPYYVRKYVEMGMGIALIPCVSWKGMMSENTVMLDAGNHFRKVYLYSPHDKQLSRCESLFADIIRETFNEESK